MTHSPGIVTSYQGLLTCRIFLGLFEGMCFSANFSVHQSRTEWDSGGLLPGVNLYLASFYPRRMLQLR